jgi:DnaJ-class molecular chaperone
MTDFYKILGVSEDVSNDELKRTFRKLSLKHHPDKGGNESKFKEINEAYTVLSNPESRKEYDMKRKFGMGGMGGMGGINPEDILNQIFGGMGGRGPMGNPFGNPFGFSVNGHNGHNGHNVRIFRNGVEVNQNSMNKPIPIVKHIDITLEEAFTGVQKSLNIKRWIKENNFKKEENENIYVDVPRGIDNNEIIILKDKGNVINDQLKGDIKIFINIVNNTDFKRNGLDIIYEKKITLCEALCGFKFNLKLLNGKTVIINNSDSIIHFGYKKNIPGFGFERNNKKGNLILMFSIEFPNSLTKEQKDKIREALQS